MRHFDRRFSRITGRTLAGYLLILTIGCQKPASEASKTAAGAPAKTTHPVSEADLNTIELTEDAVLRPGLQTDIVSMREMPRARAYGAELMLPAGASVIVSAPLAGTLQLQTGESYPQIGQQVTDGDPLLHLLPMLSPEREVLTPAERIRFAEARNAVAQSQNDADAQVQQSMVQVEAAQIALERAERLLKDKSGTIRTVDEAQAQLKLAQAAQEAARTRKQIIDSIKLGAESGTLQPLTIRSPLSGMVRAIQVQSGQIVAAGAGNDPIQIGDGIVLDSTVAASQRGCLSGSPACSGTTGF